jgi:hypothetical protein
VSASGRTIPGQLEAAADIVDGFATFAVTTAATTLITVAAGTTWQGTVSLNCSCANAGANAVQAQATAVVSVSGAGATPAAGNYLRCSAYAGANVAAGTVGDSAANSINVPFTVVAGAGAPALIQVATTQAGTVSEVNASCIGQLI